ncbi:hypothetical protein [Flagellimonas sp.]|uniref:hypothetical protein n=1 Tax=Flagellimonas sp. TaxID=2058762 RepID=UPI003F49E901
MNTKNLIENLILIVVMFVGLGVYTQMVLKPIVVESIKQETTKIEQNIDQKFKKVGQVDAVTTPSAKAISTTETDVECVDISPLSESRRNRIKKWLDNQ